MRLKIMIKTISCEPFLYGKRIKAILKTYENDKNLRSYEVILYKHHNEIYKQKLFFDNSINPKDYKRQNDLYIKAHEYALNYLNNICIY